MSRQKDPKRKRKAPIPENVSSLVNDFLATFGKRLKQMIPCDAEIASNELSGITARWKRDAKFHRCLMDAAPELTNTIEAKVVDSRKEEYTQPESSYKEICIYMAVRLSKVHVNSSTGSSTSIQPSLIIPSSSALSSALSSASSSASSNSNQEPSLTVSSSNQTPSLAISLSPNSSNETSSDYIHLVLFFHSYNNYNDGDVIKIMIKVHKTNDTWHKLRRYPKPIFQKKIRKHLNSSDVLVGFDDSFNDEWFVDVCLLNNIRHTLNIPNDVYNQYLLTGILSGFKSVNAFESIDGNKEDAIELVDNFLNIIEWGLESTFVIKVPGDLSLYFRNECVGSYLAFIPEVLISIITSYIDLVTGFDRIPIDFDDHSNLLDE